MDGWASAASPTLSVHLKWISETMWPLSVRVAAPGATEQSPLTPEGLGAAAAVIQSLWETKVAEECVSAVCRQQHIVNWNKTNTQDWERQLVFIRSSSWNSGGRRPTAPAAWEPNLGLCDQPTAVARWGETQQTNKRNKAGTQTSSRCVCDVPAEWSTMQGPNLSEPPPLAANPLPGD